MNILDEVDRVFVLEIDTLLKVHGGLDDSYIKEAELLYRCPGEVVISAMGMSGLIAQKIAGTMVSTGTPAVFLHPGEEVRPGAVHADALVDLDLDSRTDERLRASRPGGC